MNKELEKYWRDSQKRRIEIMQDQDDLIEEYAHRLNYDHKDWLFLSYVASRTGILATAGEELLDPNNIPEYEFLLIVQCRLQDCWEIFKQPGIREEYAMRKLLEDGRRRMKL